MLVMRALRRRADGVEACHRIGGQGDAPRADVRFQVSDSSFDAILLCVADEAQPSFISILANLSLVFNVAYSGNPALRAAVGSPNCSPFKAHAENYGPSRAKST